MVTGIFEGTASFGSGISLTSAGSWDIFVAKVSSSGAWVWALRAGGSSYDSGWGISALADGSAVVTGGFDETGRVGRGVWVTSAGDDVSLEAKVR